MKQHPVVFSVTLMAILWSLPISVHAAAVVATSIARDAGPLAIAIQALLVLVAAIVVTALGLSAFSNFERGDMAAGVFGVFKCLLAVVLLFVMIPALINGQVAAAAGLE